MHSITLTSLAIGFPIGLADCFRIKLSLHPSEPGWHSFVDKDMLTHLLPICDGGRNG